MFPKAGADKTPVPKVSFVAAVADLGCGVGYYKRNQSKPVRNKHVPDGTSGNPGRIICGTSVRLPRLRSASSIPSSTMS